MSIIEDDFMEIDPERAKIWEEDEDINPLTISEQVTQEEDMEQPEDLVENTEDSIQDNEELDELTEEDDLEEIVEETEETEEVEEVEETEDNEETEEETTEEDNQSEEELDEEEKQVEDTFTIKANGQEFDFSLDELKTLAPKAMDYTKKMQEIAPWRRTISALKEEGLSEEDVNFLIDVSKGDKEAIAELLKRTSVDAFDLDTDSDKTYTPNVYGKDERTIEIEEIVNDISRDQEYKITQQVVDYQWDNHSREMMAQNPAMIKGLHNDIKNGVYNKISPLALKMKAIDGGKMSDIEYYMQAGEEYFAKEEQVSNQQAQQEAKIKASQERQNEIKKKSSSRKAASIGKKISGKKDVIDYLSEDDDTYDEWYKNLMSNQ